MFDLNSISKPMRWTGIPGVITSYVQAPNDALMYHGALITLNGAALTFSQQQEQANEQD